MDKNELFTELNQSLIDAELADGFFITVTRLNDKTLTHYQCHHNFKTSDLLPSQEQIKKDILSQYKIADQPNHIRKFE